MKIYRLHSIIYLLFFILCNCTTKKSVAQDTKSYPNKPVRIIVAVATGGGVDLQARLFANRLSENFNKIFLVENRPSASGADAFGLVANGEPDGHLLLAVNPSFTVPQKFAKNLPSPLNDFTPIALLSRAPFLFVVHPSLPVRSVKDFIALAKSKPGKLNFSGPPVGTSSHLGAAWFFSLAKINVSYIAYKGTGPAQIGLISGETEATMASIVSVSPHIKNGRLRVLGITTEKRYKDLPELPTVAEQGATGFEYVTFFGIVAPSNTPFQIVNKLNNELLKISSSKDIEKKYLDDGAELMKTNPEQFKQFIFKEVIRWNKVIETTGIKSE